MTNSKPRLLQVRWRLCLLLLAGNAFAQSEAVSTRRAAQLREAPGEASRVMANLPLQTAATRLGERQGPWIKVRTADGVQGWVHMFDVASSSSATSTSSTSGNMGTGALRSITGFFNKGSGQANAVSMPTSTVGIRGLGAEDIASAQPNMAALAQLDGARVDASQARQFASMASLASRSVKPLAIPAAPARSSAPAGAGAGNGGQFQGGG